jgi:hypothetical protein
LTLTKPFKNELPYITSGRRISKQISQTSGQPTHFLVTGRVETLLANLLKALWRSVQKNFAIDTMSSVHQEMRLQR